MSMHEESWIEGTEELLAKRYGVTLSDCTPDGIPSEADLRMAPEDFVEWVGEKFGLTPLDQKPW